MCICVKSRVFVGKKVEILEKSGYINPYEIRLMSFYPIWKQKWKFRRLPIAQMGKHLILGSGRVRLRERHVIFSSFNGSYC